MLEWIILAGFISFLCGVILTLATEHYIMTPTGSQRLEPNNMQSSVPGDTPLDIELPQEMREELEKANHQEFISDQGTKLMEGAMEDETILAINLLVQCAFREAQSNGLVRRFLLGEINKEMKKGISEGLVSKIVKGLKIYDIDLGSQAPSIGKVDVKKILLDDEKRLIQALDVNIHLTYSGDFDIGIDVFLAYGKTAFVSAKVARLEGDLLLQFSREPYSHWSIAFYPPPDLEVTVGSRIQGHSYSVVTDLMASMIQSWIQKQHSLPFYKMRTKPFFLDPDILLSPIPPPTCIRKGTLQVTVRKMSRIDQSLLADGCFCILAADSCPWVDISPADDDGHIHLDIRTILKRNRPLGFVFHGLPSSDSANLSSMDEMVEGLVGRRRDGGVVIVGTEPGSTADEAGFRSGDVIEAVNDVAVSSAQQFLMTVTSIKSQFVIVRVDRYIPSIRKKVADAMLAEGLDIPLYPESDDDLVAKHRETIGQIVGLEIKRTELYPMSKEVVMNDVQIFHITPDQRYINLSVWLTGVHNQDVRTTNKNVLVSSDALPSDDQPSTSSGFFFSLSKLFSKNREVDEASLENDNKELKDCRLGYANISLAEIISDCHLNTQGHNISTYQIFPADIKASLGQKNPLNQQDGFDPRLCYGDIVLSFVFKPSDEEAKQDDSTSIDESEDEQIAHLAEEPRIRRDVDVVMYELKRPHDWMKTHVDQQRSCFSCHLNIRPKDCLYCQRCDSECHKKCIRHLNDRLKWCRINQSIAKIDDFYISNVPLPSSNIKHYSIMEESTGNPFQVTMENEVSEMEAAVERLQTWNHNESLVKLAKSSGKFVFNHLSGGDRRAKLSSMMDRIELAIQGETVRRYELASEWEKANGGFSGSSASGDGGCGDPKWVEVELVASERKRQALILLLLYYNAGWLDADDTEFID